MSSSAPTGGSWSRPRLSRASDCATPAAWSQRKPARKPALSQCHVRPSRRSACMHGVPAALTPTRCASGRALPAQPRLRVAGSFACGALHQRRHACPRAAAWSRMIPGTRRRCCGATALHLRAATTHPAPTEHHIAPAPLAQMRRRSQLLLLLAASLASLACAVTASAEGLPIYCWGARPLPCAAGAHAAALWPARCEISVLTVLHAHMLLAHPQAEATMAS